MGTIQCWSGNSNNYADSGGVEWQGEQGRGVPGPAPAPGPRPSPGPAPAPGPIAPAGPGALCDLTTCACDGVDLGVLKGHTFTAPEDESGYSYKLSLCAEIPNADLPAGCGGRVRCAALTCAALPHPIAPGPCAAIVVCLWRLQLPALKFVNRCVLFVAFGYRR